MFNIYLVQLIMHDFITIYAYLIIATIAFAMPIVLTLLSIFSEAISQVKKQALERENTFRSLIKELTEDPNFNTREVTERSKIFMKEKKQSDIKLKLLSPKKQLLFVGFTLFSSLFLIFTDMVLRDNQWRIISHRGSIICIIFSLGMFTISIIRLKKITWALVESKIDYSQKFVEVEKDTVAQEGILNA